jgi:CMD domain protein
MTTDIIDRLAEVRPGSDIDRLRQRRAQARTNSQASYDALFNAPEETGVTRTERLAVAAFVAALHRDDNVQGHYRTLLEQAAGRELAELVDEAAAAAATEGPYGRFPATADLRTEDAPGPVLHLDSTTADELGQRLTAALQYAHLLVFRPRESSAEALAALVDAGWSTAQIVTLAQLVAFLSFQLRVVSGLRVLQEAQS